MVRQDERREVNCRSRFLYPHQNRIAGVSMTEERKHAILFAATLLCARKLIETIAADKPNLTKQYFVDKAIQEAEFILERIDRKWPQS
jgi:hypothetical protein